VHLEAVTAGQTARAVPGRGDDGDSGGGGRGCSGLVLGTTLKAEEERDGDDGEGGGAGRR
jgi:hypothetical protein